jgi:hypothetical protein
MPVVGNKKYTGELSKNSRFPGVVKIIFFHKFSVSLIFPLWAENSLPLEIL